LSIFSNPEIIKLINENFIPVTGNDWFQRRRKDAVGEFFLKVANQGPRKGEDGSTRQGHYTFTADGKLLVYNNNRSVDRHLGMIQETLKKWQALPAAEREPAANKIEKLGAEQLDKQYAQLMPKGTVVLKTSTRLLKERGGIFSAITKSENTNDWGHLAAHNNVWLQAKEIAQLRELNSEKPVDLPKPITFRLLRYHFVDNTRGEPSLWSRESISNYKITLRTPKEKPQRRLIEGRFLIEDGGERGFEAKILGWIDIDPKADALSDVKLMVLGDHWGSGNYTRGARPGKTPLGIAISLADVKNDSAATIPPQGSGWLDGYWDADRR
jgi:hypothetical protein